MLKRLTVGLALINFFGLQAFGAYYENDDRKTGAPRMRVLPEMRVSGSGQFSEDQFALIISHLIDSQHVHPSRILVLDLREEVHFFADGIPFTATDIHETPSDAYKVENENFLKDELSAFSTLYIEPRKLDKDSDEKEKKGKHSKGRRALDKKDQPKHSQEAIKGFKGILDHKYARNKPIVLKKPVLRTEAELARLYGVGYKRLPLTDHFPPAIEQLLRLRDFLETLPKDTWVHIHCRGGEGRTTTVLAMLEMLRFPDHNFEAILDHQKKIGGKNLAKIPEEADRQKPARDRLAVLRSMYDNLHQ